MKIDTCTYSNGDGQSIPLISNGQNNAALGGLVTINGLGTSNRYAEFDLHVFQIHDSDQGTFSCDMKLDPV